MNEIWKAVVGYEGLYEVSNEGRVRSLVPCSRGKWQCPHYLSPGNVRGYWQIILCKDGKKKSALVHRLVAIAFIGPPPTPKHEVNHRDFDQGHNRVENLEWLTSGDNNRYSSKVIPRLRGEANRSKLTEEQVREIRARYIPRQCGYIRLAKEYGVSDVTIYKIVKRMKWAHVV